MEGNFRRVISVTVASSHYLSILALGFQTNSRSQLMSSTYTIYHNPRCSKSRQTLALLEEHNITPSVVEYLSNPPDAATLASLLELLGCTPRELMRRKEAAYIEAKLDDASLTEAELINAMITQPIVIERPIVVKHDGTQATQAVIGRPPENVLALFR